MNRHTLPECELERYNRHGIASVPLSQIGWEGITIEVPSGKTTPEVRYAWIRHGEVKISSGQNKAPPSALEITAGWGLDELRVIPCRFHVSDPLEYARFLLELDADYVIFERSFQGNDGIRIALEPVYPR